jgi:hypothetical protein
MTIHVLTLPGQEDLYKATKFDCSFVDITNNVVPFDIKGTAMEQLDQLKELKLESGDIVCMAGLCPRPMTFHVSTLAKETKENYMPGLGIDHRSVAIATGKMQHRLPIENNYQMAWPYVMVIGNVESAMLSFELLKHLDPADYWPEYTPQEPILEHLLSVAATAGNWQTPNWFKVVDLSIRDLEIAPIMYASHTWHDWISFYPSNGNMKLENHAQLFPVWLAGSKRPLEYWQRVS